MKAAAPDRGASSRPSIVMEMLTVGAFERMTFYSLNSFNKINILNLKWNVLRLNDLYFACKLMSIKVHRSHM